MKTAFPWQRFMRLARSLTIAFFLAVLAIVTTALVIQVGALTVRVGRLEGRK
jgi:hypothetical protein